MLLNCFVKYLLISLMAIALAVRVSPRADEPSKCAAAPHVLWGDGEHDDTAALNAWFRGENVIWVHSHEVVGDELADRTFLLSSAIYISSGTGRKLERFRMIWPERNETVSGGSIVAGNDTGQAPVADGVTTIGADPDEGVPYET